MGRERGSATVLVVGVIAVLIMVMTGALAVARVVNAASRAAAAADMAAVAGARVLQTGTSQQACAEAGRVAALNQAHLVECVTQGQSLAVRADVPSGVVGIGTAIARARAGPAES